MTLRERAEALNAMKPHLIADVELYARGKSMRRDPIPPGYGCLCIVSLDPSATGFDAWLMLGDQSMAPGEKRRLGFVFGGGEPAARELRRAGKFYLWERGAIGEAAVVTAKH